MSTESILEDKTQSMRFFPVSIGSLDACTLALDLYFKPAGVSKPVLYRSTGVAFSVKDQQRLIAQGIEFLYIPIEHHAIYRRELTERMDRLYHDPGKNRAERMRLIRASCAKMIEDVLVFPGQSEALDSVADISRQFAAWSTEDNEQFSYLLDMAAHDYYTITHMMNVGVGCGLLAKELRPGEEELQSWVIQGGLLHDIGKRGVPNKLLNKEGRLAPEEWELIKRHPIAGGKELEGRPAVPDAVLEMVRGHHERPDGKGYPSGLAGDQVGFAARVCSVVDVFDAICSKRPYRGPTPPLDTLDIMREGVGGQFDPDVFDAWTAIVQGLVEKDPKRALPRQTDRPAVGLGDFGQRKVTADAAPAEQPPATAARAPRAESAEPAMYAEGERRRHPRFPCDLRVTATFVRQGKVDLAELGRSVEVHILNVSQSGVQLRTPWPLSLNDELRLTLPVGPSRTITRTARVVRVRRGDGDGWIAGARFVGD